MFQNKRIFVIAAHPDDELLGCGASIRKWADNGAEINALILATGLASRPETASHELPQGIHELRENARAAAAIVGYQNIRFEDFPDNRMDSVDLLDVVHTIMRYVKEYEPEVVLTHHHSDLNIDHRITYQAVITACRPLQDCSVKSILSFETVSSTEWSYPYYKNCFSPNLFVDVTDFLKAKLDAMACYTTELRPAPHPRSLEMLRASAMRWGSVIECPFAEAFELVYGVVR